ncbi:MAG: thiamine phosphate synthase [Phascolarctobacterium sp.]|uniref:thiamine phosphate synthase n=1 Tax=Phascolarctobacterium sp. TaxID=2049039 RepID=UPI0025F1B9CC|nr:thiamine phosphate synthase [Phascolarctobacterium sp.]MCC8158620.1 thiamine phosphate synthase [Phascolarctobacterium sp.]
MFKLLAVTDPASCREAFADRLRRLAASGIDALILRAKELPPQDYLTLAAQAHFICQANRLPLILHTCFDACQSAGSFRLHVSYPQLVQQPQLRTQLQRLGVSVHTLAEARQAAALGADYLIAGHIFATACKQGLPGRGTDFLRAVCDATPLPVYAIGGITPANISRIKKAGAAGACLMSSLMTCPKPALLVQELRRELGEEHQDFF